MLWLAGQLVAPASKLNYTFVGAHRRGLCRGLRPRLPDVGNHRSITIGRTLKWKKVFVFDFLRSIADLQRRRHLRTEMWRWLADCSIGIRSRMVSTRHLREITSIVVWVAVSTRLCKHIIGLTWNPNTSWVAVDLTLVCIHVRYLQYAPICKG